MIRMVRYDRKGHIIEVWEGTPSQYQAFISNAITRTGWVGR